MEEPESEPSNPSDLSIEDPAILQSEEQEKEQHIQEEGDPGNHDGFLKDQAAKEGGGGGDGVVGEDGSLKNDEGKEEDEVDVVEGGALSGRFGEEPELELMPMGAEEKEGGGDGVIGEDELLKNEEVKVAEVRSGEESEAAGAGDCSSLNPGEETQAQALDGEEERESDGREVDNQMEEEKLRPLDNERVSECGKEEEEMKLTEEEDEKEVNAPLVQPKEESEQEIKEGNEQYELGTEAKKAPLEDGTWTEICRCNEEEMEPPLPGEEKPPLIQPGEGSEKIEPEKPEELEEVASENPVAGGEADKMAVDVVTDATKVAAKRGTKGRKKVPVKGPDESLGDEESEDGPAKAAGKRGAKIRKNTHTKDQDDATGEGEAKEAKVDSEGPSKTAGSSGNLSGKKRGRPRTSQGGRIRGPPKQKEDEESLCFICFDGGDLVVCDHRGCPKVYHPACVNRDDAYFQAKGQWNCGWHICSKCTKSARYMCYTCTYSLCKGCIKDAGFVFVRQNKGFCETCIKTVMMIETNEYEDETMAGLDFDDKNSWLYLFKDYWVELKEKLSLTLEELTRARTLSKDSNVVSQYEKPLDNLGEACDDQGGGSSSSFPGGRKASVSSSKKARKRSRKNKEDSVKEVEAEGTSSSEEPEWASKELLEFVAHMKDGDSSVLSQFDVQALLLQYIRLNNLRDPRNRGQIRCDSRLWTLFGKSRVGHLEMLKLLESHFLLKEASPLAADDNQGGVVDPDPSQMEGNSDASTKIALYMKRKSRRKVDGNEPAHIDDYAAIDVHNINFLYLRRNLMEELLNEIDTFSENVVGSFVRIRISALGQKQDLYRLVQVVGTGKAAEKYKIGKRATDITLEILNLDKREYMTLDIISNQDFTEEECKRLRQSVKCGLIDRLTVGEVQEKARALQNAKVNDWLESEKLRLGNLRDRASEKGRRKELRECVEKLQLLSTPEERIRRLNEDPDVHADPHMDPDYESAEDEDLDSKKHDVYNRPQESLYRGRDGLSPGKAASISLKISDTWDSNRSTPNNCDQVSPAMGDQTYEFSGNRVNRANLMDCSEISHLETNTTGTGSDIQNNNHSVMKPLELSTVPPETVPGSLSVTPSTPSETEKMWNYQDPSGKIQGPFSMTQLRKWNTSGFFPANLKIWRTSEKQEDSILLTDALIGKFKDIAQEEPQQNNSQPANRAAATDCRVNSSDGGWRGNINQHPPAGAMGSDNLTKADRWTTQPSSFPVTNTVVVNPVDGRSAASSSDWESSKESNGWCGQQQGNDSHRTSFPRNSSHYPFYPGRDDRGNTGRWNGGRGRQNNWNSNRQRRFQPNDRGSERQHPYRSSSGQQFSGEQWKSQPARQQLSGEQWKSQPARQQFSGEQWKNQPARQQFSGEQWKNQPDNGSSNQLRNSFVNLPAPIPPQSSIDWTSLQGALNKILPSASSAHLMTSGQVQQSPVQTNVSNILSPTLHSVGGWSSSSGPTASSIQAQENVHLLSNLQVPNQQNKPSEGAASNILDIQQRFSGSTSAEFHVATSKCDGAAGNVQAANSQPNETGNPSIVPCHEPDSDKRDLEARDGSASESKTKSVDGEKLDLSSSLPTVSGSLGLPDASVPAQISKASSSSQPQPESQRLVPVSAQQIPGGAVNPVVNPAPPLNLGWGVAGQNPSLGTGTAQVVGNMVYGPAVQGAANMGWGMMAPGAMNMAWTTPANLNMAWAPPTQAIPNASLGMAVPAQGNANMNLARVPLPATQGNTNPSTGLGAQMQVNSTLNSGWIVPSLGNTNPNPGWVGPIAGNTNQNAIWGTPGQGAMSNMGMAWDPSGGNPYTRNPRT